ncbi:HNH endonuclease [Chryseobacterium arthrosphaerae]|uniref:HNH endonuclease n=1 Tax=Chryseobacterium arthrosphaerae TaxID=651561 RepID=UPI000F4E2F6F|nr:HNH endonuclease [Chryseobacterium arthrosphaerae]AYZ13724.1 HNH endonuclease [Chryseobacterium arthrosphaerae]
MIIDLPKIKLFYEYAVKVYNKEIKLKQAKKELEENGINPNSANYYFYIYPSLIKGTIFKGTINAEATRYYLDRIYETKGLVYLKNALQAISLHIDYYPTVSKSKMVTLREIHGEYLRKYQVSYDEYFDEEIEKDKILIEGLTKQITVNIYERNPIARSKCIEHFGAVCKVCDFDFEQKYGVLGKGFIHVHHILDLSLIKKEYEVDFKKDLVPVCPNCHTMLHKRKPALQIDELRKLLQK